MVDEFWDSLGDWGDGAIFEGFWRGCSVERFEIWRFEEHEVGKKRENGKQND